MRRILILGSTGSIGTQALDVIEHSEDLEVVALAEATQARVIPVDSEHSALFQLLRGEPPGGVDRLVLTASGGPFRGRTSAELGSVDVDSALAHPTWDMGGKITIDSATLMN